MQDSGSRTTALAVDDAAMANRKERARAWFETLRDEICKAFEGLEAALPASAPLAERAPGHFQRTPWTRADHTGKPGGGGEMAMMKGRVFEKVGVHVSTVLGEFAPEFRGEIPGAQSDPRAFSLDFEHAALDTGDTAEFHDRQISNLALSQPSRDGGGDRVSGARVRVPVPREVPRLVKLDPRLTAAALKRRGTPPRKT